LGAVRRGTASVDGWAEERPLPDNPLISDKNCFITPHIGWATYQSRQRLLDITIDNLKSFIAGNPQNVVRD